MKVRRDERKRYKPLIIETESYHEEDVLRTALVMYKRNVVNDSAQWANATNILALIEKAGK